MLSIPCRSLNMDRQANEEEHYSAVPVMCAPLTGVSFPRFSFGLGKESELNAATYPKRVFDDDVTV